MTPGWRLGGFTTDGQQSGDTQTTIMLRFKSHIRDQTCRHRLSIMLWSYDKLRQRSRRMNDQKVLRCRLMSVVL